MALSEIDRNLLERCLQGRPRAWEDFVDRFMGLVVHVVNHTAQGRAVRLSSEDREDLCGEVFVRIVEGDFALLRRFRGQSSLATYLTVVARRTVVHKLMARAAAETPAAGLDSAALGRASSGNGPLVEERLSNREEIERMLQGLDGREAQVVRMYHLEGKTYREISAATGLAENSIGPVLSRARDKMRRSRINQPSS